MRIRLLVLGAGILFFTAGSVALSGAPVENKGAAEIKLPGTWLAATTLWCITTWP